MPFYPFQSSGSALWLAMVRLPSASASRWGMLSWRTSHVATAKASNTAAPTAILLLGENNSTTKTIAETPIMPQSYGILVQKTSRLSPSRSKPRSHQRIRAPAMHREKGKNPPQPRQIQQAKQIGKVKTRRNQDLWMKNKRTQMYPQEYAADKTSKCHPKYAQNAMRYHYAI